MNNDLPTRLWLDGHLRQLAARGVFYTIVHKGDEGRGTVALKLNLGRSEGCRILVQVRTPEGTLAWLSAFDNALVTEDQADMYLARLTDRDPDVWVVEIESRDGSHPFSGLIF